MRREHAVLIALTLVGLSVGCASPPEPTSALIGALLPDIPPDVLIDGLVRSDEWEGALVFRDTFVIRDDAAVNGEYPLELFVAGNSSALVVGVRVDPVPASPYIGSPDFLGVRLTTNKLLQPPADALYVGNVRHLGYAWEDHYWTGERWQRQREFADGDPNDGRPIGGRWAAGGVAGEALHFEYFLPRTSTQPEWDGFDVQGAGAFGLQLHFWRQPEAGSGSEGSHSDYYPRPQEGASPLDASSWIWLQFKE